MKNPFYPWSMLLRKAGLLITAFLVSYQLAYSQNIDSRGTEFWLMFNANILGDLNNPDPVLQMFITSEFDATGNVAIPGLAFSEDFTLDGGTVITVVVPLAAMVQGADEIKNTGIHVTSDVEVTVYGLNQRNFSSDAYLGLPVDALGTDYLVMSYQNQNSFNVSRSQFGVVATEDGTVVTITPTANIGAKLAGVPYVVNLDEGDIYQGRALLALGDVTGTTISSNKPIGVYGSHLCATVPLAFGFCDHLTQMLPAKDTWGQNFVTVPFANRLGGDIFRIMAAEDATQVNINGALVATLNSGAFFETILTEASQITTSKPALVAQFMQGNQVDGTLFPGDPFMMLVAPFEQFLGNYTVSTPATGFIDNYVNVVVANAGVGNVTLDGETIPAEDFEAIGSSGFSGAQIEIELGSHNLNSTFPFGVFVYGVNADDSYGYPGGQLFSLVATAFELGLSPEESSAPVTTEVCVEASLTDDEGEPVSGVRIDFEVSGTNSISGFSFTNDDGIATYCYTSTEEGDDVVTALQGGLDASVSVSWIPAPLDCNDDPFGEAYFDQCQVCVGGNTGLEPCIEDCNGIAGGSAILDDCNVCRTSDDPDFNTTCLDCNGEVNGDATAGSPCTTETGESGTLSENCMCVPNEPGDECYGHHILLYEMGGGNIPLNRREEGNAIGEPERDETLNFVSLGFGGTLIIGFEEAAIAVEGADDLEVAETSFGNPSCNAYKEQADIYVSQQVVTTFEEIDDSQFQYVGQSCTNGASFDVFDATGFEYFTLVKIVDVSPQIGNRDGYDVDGIVALQGCAPVPNPEVVPDPGDCYATDVLEYSPTASASNLNVNRTDPSRALHAPQRNNTLNFVALGYGGSLVLGFDGSAAALPGVNDLEVVETTFGNQTCASYEERAKVYVSQQVLGPLDEVDDDGFLFVDEICTKGGFLDVHAATGWNYFTMVKIVDVTPLAAQLGNRDGFDVDGIVLLHNCEVPGTFQAPVELATSPAKTMFSAHPNPTSGPSVVSFTLSQTQRTTLEVYDLAGRQLGSLFNATAEAGQSYRVNFDASHLPNGIYLYRLSTDNEVRIEKFILTR